MIIVTAFTALPVGVQAAETDAQSAGASGGTTGDCTWTLDDGVLTISGNGAMGNYDVFSSPTPWETDITDVVIDNGVTHIGDMAFYGCTELAGITIPDSVTSIGDLAFYGCTELTDITIPDSVTTIGGYALDDTAWYDNQPDGLVYAGKVAYKYKGEMPEGTSVEIAPGNSRQRNKYRK